MMHLNGQTILILGLGDSGLSIAQWCAQQGATVYVWDSRAAPPQLAQLAQLVPSAIRLHGALTVETLDALNGVQTIFKSPGLAPHDPKIAALVAYAATRGIPILGELQLFIDALAQLKIAKNYAPKILAITGTNGKTKIGRAHV